MKNKNAVNGQMKGVQNITRLGAVLITVSLAATSAPAVSASRSVAYGNTVFACKATVGFNDYAVGNKYRATVSAEADAKMLWKKVPLVSGSSSLEIKHPSNCRAYGTFKLAGNTVASWSKSFTGSADFATDVFDASVGVEKKFTIPVPWLPDLTVKGKAKARVRLSAKGSIRVSLSPTTGLPVVRGSISPEMDATATASGGVGPFHLGGSIKLVGIGLNEDLTYSHQTAGNPKVDYCAKAFIEGTEGSIGIGPLQWTYHGGETELTLACGSRQL